MAAFTARPTDNFGTNWNVNAYTNIDEVVEQPDAGDGSAIMANKDDDNEYQVYYMTDLPVDGTVTAITMWMYAKSDNSGQPLDMGYYDGSWNLVAKSLTTSYAWYSNTWSGLSLTKAQFDAALMGFLTGAQGNNEDIYVDLAYWTVTYTPSFIAKVTIF